MAKTHISSAARRSTRTRTRPVIFSGSPSRGDDDSHLPSLVSPEPVASSSSSSTAVAAATKKKKSGSIPSPDTPVSSMSISEAKAVAMKMAMATMKASIGDKRKRTTASG